MSNVIDSFTGKYSFLSNFSPHPVFAFGRGWKTAEHAYQGAKTAIPSERDYVALQQTPGKAKRAGRKVTLIEGWDEVKIDMMTIIVRKKFSQHPDIQKKLIDTGDAELIEGNHWGDKYWGVCDGEGENHLGKILMQIREELKSQ